MKLSFTVLVLTTIVVSTSSKANIWKFNSFIETEQQPGIAAKDSVNDNDSIYAIVDQMPQFEGGESGLMKFIINNLKYPTEAFRNKEHGRVVVRFEVNKDGKVVNAEVVHSISFTIDKEALRIVNIIPDFIPAMHKGKNVSVFYTLPISFIQD